MLQLAAIHAFRGCCQRPRKAKKKKEVDHHEIGSGQLLIVGLLTENCFQLKGCCLGVGELWDGNINEEPAWEMPLGNWGQNSVGYWRQNSVGVLGNAVGVLGQNSFGVLGPELCWGTGGRTLLGNRGQNSVGCWGQNSVGYWGLLLGNWGQNSDGELGTAVGESRETD